MIYGLMRRAPGKGGKLVDSLMPAPPLRPTSWKNEEFNREGEAFKMPKLWGTGGKPAQNKQLGKHLPDQFLSLTGVQLNHLKEWADGNFGVGVLQQPVALEKLPLSKQPHALDSSALTDHRWRLSSGYRISVLDHLSGEIRRGVSRE